MNKNPAIVFLKRIEQLDEQNRGHLVIDSVKVDFENTWSDAEGSIHLALFRCNPITVDDFEDGVSTLKEWGLTRKIIIFGAGEGNYLWYFDFGDIPNEPRIVFGYFG